MWGQKPDDRPAGEVFMAGQLGDAHAALTRAGAPMVDGGRKLNIAERILWLLKRTENLS